MKLNPLPSCYFVCVLRIQVLAFLLVLSFPFGHDWFASICGGGRRENQLGVRSTHQQLLLSSNVSFDGVVVVRVAEVLFRDQVSGVSWQSGRVFVRFREFAVERQWIRSALQRRPWSRPRISPRQRLSDARRWADGIRRRAASLRGRCVASIRLHSEFVENVVFAAHWSKGGATGDVTVVIQTTLIHVY